MPCAAASRLWSQHYPQDGFVFGEAPNAWLERQGLRVEASGALGLLRLADYEAEVDEDAGHRGRSALTGLVGAWAPKANRLRHIFITYILLFNIIFKLQTGAAIAPARVLIEPETLRAAAGSAVAALKVLANEDRLLLLCQLSQGEMCVSDLESTLGIHQPTLSQQLGVLRNEGVVKTRREGKLIFYSVTDKSLLKILELLYRLYCPKG